MVQVGLRPDPTSCCFSHAGPEQVFERSCTGWTRLRFNGKTSFLNDKSLDQTGLSIHVTRAAGGGV